MQRMCLDVCNETGFDCLLVWYTDGDVCKRTSSHVHDFISEPKLPVMPFPDKRRNFLPQLCKRSPYLRDEHLSQHQFTKTTQDWAFEGLVLSTPYSKVISIVPDS